LRQEAIDVLAGRPDADPFLEDLGAGSTKPRLPWGLRRHVRRLLRERRKGSR
jgi:hypothetical protein